MEFVFDEFYEPVVGSEIDEVLRVSLPGFIKESLCKAVELCKKLNTAVVDRRVFIAAELDRFLSSTINEQVLRSVLETATVYGDGCDIYKNVELNAYQLAFGIKNIVVDIDAAARKLGGVIYG